MKEQIWNDKNTQKAEIELTGGKVRKRLSTHKLSFSESSALEGDRVFRIRHFVKMKMNFDGFSTLLIYVTYCVLSGIIPVMLFDHYDGQYRAIVNQKITAYTDYEGTFRTFKGARCM